ncbi:MAG: arylesterase [Alphaproteobacteria bacterium]|nr:arylesterase [Alphaproteobacteria bacterium]
MVNGTGGRRPPPAGRRPPRRYGALGRLFNAGALILGLILAPGAMAASVKLLALGDSLTAGFGLPTGDGFTARLQRALRAAGYDVTVVNGGVSGDTSAGGLARLDWALADKPDAALVALGANDALRALEPAQTEANLDRILARLKAAGVRTLLVGMLAPPNLGREYGAAFDAIYARLAERHGVPLYPFFLDGVAADAALNQPDGIHPNAAGVAVVVARMLPAVTRLLDGLGR